MAGLLLAMPKYLSHYRCRNPRISSSTWLFVGFLLFCFVCGVFFLGFLFVWLVCFGVFLTLSPQSSHFWQKYPDGTLQLCPFLELFFPHPPAGFCCFGASPISIHVNWSKIPRAFCKHLQQQFLSPLQSSSSSFLSSAPASHVDLIIPLQKLLMSNLDNHLLFTGVQQTF